MKYCYVRIKGKKYRVIHSNRKPRGKYRYPRRFPKFYRKGW